MQNEPVKPKKRPTLPKKRRPVLQATSISSRPSEIVKEWPDRLIDLVSEAEPLSTALKALGVSATIYEAWKASHPEFAKQIKLALEHGADHLESRAVKRALNGSDRMLMFLLKGAKPEKFGDKLKVESNFTPLKELKEQVQAARAKKKPAADDSAPAA